MIHPRERGLPVRLSGYESWSYRNVAGEFGGNILVSMPVPSDGEPPVGPPTRWLIVLGDVSGKGRAASLLVEELQDEVMRLVDETSDPAMTLDRLDTFHGGDEGFVTLVVAVIDGVRHELTVANAGHVSPLLRKGDGRVEALGESGTGYPLWVLSEQRHRSITAPIGPGEAVVFRIDAVTAQPDPRHGCFTNDRLLLSIGQADPGARAVGESIVRADAESRGGRARTEDLTLICIGRTAADC